MPLTVPRLWVVATPLGNIGDLSPRAREVLENADIVLAEDTRRTAKLFRDCGVTPSKLISFFEHNEDQRLSEIIEALRSGANVALVSDAGTPLLSDPGYTLVRACRQQGIEVSPVPGPCAPIAALSAAGIAPLPFTFLGFLPRSEGARRELFSRHAQSGATIIFFERKDRLKSSLAIALSVLDKRELAICRELTKTYEQFVAGNLEDYEKLCDNLAGELTIVIGPPKSVARMSESEVLTILDAGLASGLKIKQAAQAASSQCPGWTAKEIYRAFLERRNGE